MKISLIASVVLMTLCCAAEDSLKIKPGSEHWQELFEPPVLKPTELASKDPLRKTLFDLLRPRIQEKAKIPVRFRGSLKVFKNWAFYVGDTLDASGKLVGFAELDNSDTAALWLRTQDGWTLVDYSAGHSDAFFLIWPELYGTPKALIGIE